MYLNHTFCNINIKAFYHYKLNQDIINSEQNLVGYNMGKLDLNLIITALKKEN